jgi:hypothetical protein
MPISTALNGRHHRAWVSLFMVVVLAHWAEHIAQTIQIWGLGWPVPRARGLLGLAFPWLISSEWLHYGFALVMLVGLWALQKGFTGRARIWWMIAFGLQFWHHIEHLLLLIQAQTGYHLLGRPVPTSVVQLVLPRVQLHLFYNAVVFLPMVVAMYHYLKSIPATSDRPPADRADHVAEHVRP